MPTHQQRLVAMNRNLSTFDWDLTLESLTPTTGPAMTFANSGPATRVDASGNVRFAPHQLLENSRLGTQISGLPSGWSKVNSTDFDAIVNWNDLGDDTWEYEATASTQTGGMEQDITPVLADSTKYTVIVYISDAVRTAGSNVCVNVVEAGGGTGSFMRTTSFSVAGWYALGLITGPSGSPTTEVLVQIGIGAAADASGNMTFRTPGLLLGWLPSVTTGDTGVLLSEDPNWLPTDDGDEPLYNQPRWQYDKDGNSEGMLVELEARTNFGLDTEDFSTANWTNINTDQPSSNTDGPLSGGMQELAATSTADQQLAVYQSYTGLTATTVSTISVLAKVGTNAQFLQLVWDADGTGADGCFCNFNLSTGAVGIATALAAGTVVSAKIKDYSDDVYRVEVVGSIASGTVGRATIGIVDNISAAAFEAADLANNDSVFITGYQAEVGRGASSYMPNWGGSAITRNADSLTTTTVSAFDADKGTWQVQGRLYNNLNDEMTLLCLDDGSALDRIRMFIDSDLTMNMETINSADTDGLSTTVGVVTKELEFQAYGAYSDDDVQVALDGTAASADTSAGLPVNDTATTFRVGNDSAGTPYMGTIKRIVNRTIRDTLP